MSDLSKFRDHCRTMATAEHRPECASLVPKPYFQRWHGIYDESGEIRALGWNGPEPEWTPAPCDCDLTDGERALFARLAGEIDEYLDPHPTLEGM